MSDGSKHILLTVNNNTTGCPLLKKIITFLCRVISQKSADIVYIAAEARNHTLLYIAKLLQKEEEQQLTWPVLHDDFMIGTARLKDWDKIDSPTWTLYLHLSSWHSYVLESGSFFYMP